MLVEHRKAVRLHVDKGVMVLGHVGHPPFACPLEDLSENGCQCDALLSSVDADTAGQWTAILKTGLRVSVKINRPPVFVNFELMGELTHSEVKGAHTLGLGIRFLPVNGQAELLKNGVFAIAMEKLHAPPPSHVDTPNDSDLGHVGADASHPHDHQQASKPPGAHIQHHEHPPIADVLVQRGRLSEDDARDASERAGATNTSVTSFLIKNRAVKTVDICQALAVQSHLPTTRLDGVDVPRSLRKVFSYLTMQRYEIVPFSESREMICVAAARPLTDAVRLELEKIAKRNLLIFLGPIDQIQDLQFRIRPRGPNQERHSVRIKTAVRADYQYCDEHGVNLDETMREGALEDISATGFRLAGLVETAYSATDLVRLGACIRIGFLFENKALQALCKIRHIENAPGQGAGKLWHLGLEITQIDPAELNDLKDACTRSTLEKMKKRNRGFNPDE